MTSQDNNPSPPFPYESYDPDITQDAIERDIKHMEQACSMMLKKIKGFRNANGFQSVPRNAKYGLSRIERHLVQIQGLFDEVNASILNPSFNYARFIK